MELSLRWTTGHELLVKYPLIQDIFLEIWTDIFFFLSIFNMDMEMRIKVFIFDTSFLLKKKIRYKKYSGKIKVSFNVREQLICSPMREKK